MAHPHRTAKTPTKPKRSKRKIEIWLDLIERGILILGASVTIVTGCIEIFQFAQESRLRSVGLTQVQVHLHRKLAKPKRDERHLPRS